MKYFDEETSQYPYDDLFEYEELYRSGSELIFTNVVLKQPIKHFPIGTRFPDVRIECVHGILELHETALNRRARFPENERHAFRVKFVIA